MEKRAGVINKDRNGWIGNKTDRTRLAGWNERED